MVTILTSFSVKALPGAKGLARLWRRDRVEISFARARGVTLKRVTYLSTGGEIRLDKLDAAVGAQRDRLLCSDKYIFPRHSGYKRFVSRRFSARLCANMAVEALSRCKNNAAVCVGIYDVSGACSDLLTAVLRMCADVTAVTSCPAPYREAARQAMEELGASALVTARREELGRCALIIAPDVIREPLCTSTDAVVLTVAPPEAEVNGSVYYRYGFAVPNGFAGIKPPDLDAEYFCSALYSLGAQYELGSIVPLTAEGEGRRCTLNSLCDCLDKQAQTIYNV